MQAFSFQEYKQAGRLKIPHITAVQQLICLFSNGGNYFLTHLFYTQLILEKGSWHPRSLHGWLLPKTHLQAMLPYHNTEMSLATHRLLSSVPQIWKT